MAWIIKKRMKQDMVYGTGTVIILTLLIISNFWFQVNLKILLPAEALCNYFVSSPVATRPQTGFDIFSHDPAGQWGGWYSAKYQSIVLID